ncbi:MAG TPA: hypothetical protein PLP17_07600, partial [Oligoflexia bacterium]|nr:hypothetical protein [Oligoflexia bacterium]
MLGHVGIGRSAAVVLSFVTFILTGCGGGSSGGESDKRSVLPWNSSSASVDTDEFDLSYENSQADDQPSTVVEPEVPASACPAYIEGVPIGIACLHCAHPNARAQALRIAEIMAQSCRKNIATTMLVDGSFGDDRDFLGEIVRIATNNGATLHLFLYLSNGPWQREHETAPDGGFGTTMPPEEFRWRIQSDAALQAEYQARVDWAMPLVSYAQTRGAVVYLLPALEDNFDYSTARVMEDLTLAAVPSWLPVALGRNPCPGCYDGNDASMVPGTFLDQHAHSAGQGIIGSSGLVTNDGRTFTFPHEAASRDAMSFDE